ILLPFVIFSYPFRGFQLRHYGMTDVDHTGKRLYTGLLIIKDNRERPPGLNDLGEWGDFLPAESNKIFSDVARSVIHEHPEYYLRTVLLRCRDIFWSPIDIPATFNNFSISSTHLSAGEYLRRYPS